jgi:hypothetical protein
MIVTLAHYVGRWFKSPDWDIRRQFNAEALLVKVNALLTDYETSTSRKLAINPATGTHISGQLYGGFRPQSCTIGAPSSSHKEGRGIDIFDENDLLDQWLTDAILTKHGLYREHPQATYLGSNGKPQPWCHLTDRAPRSKNRTFFP